jgi:hypothetical protein
MVILAVKCLCNQTQYVLHIMLHADWDIQIQAAVTRESVTSIQSEKWTIFLSVTILSTISDIRVLHSSDSDDCFLVIQSRRVCQIRIISYPQYTTAACFSETFFSIYQSAQCHKQETYNFVSISYCKPLLSVRLQSRVRLAKGCCFLCICKPVHGRQRKTTWSFSRL